MSARAEGSELTDPDGLLEFLTKTVLEPCGPGPRGRVATIWRALPSAALRRIGSTDREGVADALPVVLIYARVARSQPRL